jgi:nucleotide-binding universal stress UspA family protein
MPLFRCILFAADFSEGSREAFRVACALADQAKTRIIVLHVTERGQLVESAVAVGELGMPVVVAERTVQAENVVQRLRDSYAPVDPLNVEYRVSTGMPGDEILRVAGELGCDMIALGTHGRTGLRRLLVGSVAESVLRQAHCPVLALSSREDVRRVGPIEVIMHPTALTERSAAACRVARALAREHGARLVILHVMPVEAVEVGTVFLEDDSDVRDSLEAGAKQMDGPDLKYSIETRLTQGDVATEILREAEDPKCGLIVLGTHERTGLGRLLMGSVSEAVLRKAHCPVLTVKSPPHVVPGSSA